MRRLLLIGCMLFGVLASTAYGQTRGGFDASGRLLMHGTPRFMLGVYDSGGSYSTDPALWEQQLFSPTGPRGLQGFPLNLYLNYWMGGMPIGPTNALLDVLHNHGMMYLQTGNCFDTGSWTRYGPGSFSIMSQSYVQQYAQHPAALGYYIMDECADALIVETEQHQQQLKAWDPQGITFAATLAAGYRNPALWTNAADVLGTDPYPLYGPEPAVGYTHFIVGDFVSKLRAVAKPGRPVWSVLQFFKFTTDSRMPTAEELRAHAVMSIVEGAQGIFWWDIGSNGLRKLDAATVSAAMSQLKALTTELAGLEPALLAAPAPGALVGNSTKFADPVAGRILQLQHNITVEWLYSRKQWYQEELTALLTGNTTKSGGLLNGAANVRTLTKVVNGVGYVFAYNYTNTSRPVTFTWQSVPTSVRESKTGQTFPVSGASWNDTLGPYQARIYIINGAGATPPPPSGDLALSFTNPTSGATVSGTATVTLSATGGSGYNFTVKVDGAQVYAGTNPTFSWNTTGVADGSRALTATVTDSQSRTSGASRTVTVANGGPPPPPPGSGFTVTFSYPAAGATVNGALTVGLSTTATWGQAKTFTLSVDGAVITTQTLTGTTLWHSWNTTGVANGSRTLSAAVTMSGQTATTTLPVNVSNSGSGTGTGTLSLAYNGKLRDRVGQGNTALSADGGVDGTLTATLNASGGRTVTALQLKSSAPGTWDTASGTAYYLLGVASTLDGPLLNAVGTMAVNFAVANGGSFVVFASDAGGGQFVSGRTLTLTATFSDGSTATATTVASAPPVTLSLAYNGKLRDRVGQGNTALAVDGLLDATLKATLSASGGRTVTALSLQSSTPGTWDTTSGTAYYLLGAASTLDGPMLNAAGTMAVSFPVADGGSFMVFAADAGGQFMSGRTLTLTATFSDGSTATAVTTVAPLTVVYNGKLRDRVGQGNTSLAADGALDGTLTATLSASGGRTVTGLSLQSSAPGTWDTTSGTAYYLLGASSTLDGPLLNAGGTMAVSFAVADGGSFVVFAADAGGVQFVSGRTLTLTATFSDGSTATAVTTP